MFALHIAVGGAHGIVSETVTVFIALLGFAATVGVLTKFVRIPYTVALVLAGLAVALVNAAPAEAVITEELVLVLFLPPLLFQAALHMDLELLQRKATAMATLAIPGVLVSSAAVAFALTFFMPESITAQMDVWLPALLFGAMLAPTDPISVLATFKTAGAPAALKTLVEGESLFNDGTGVVLFLILLTAVFPAAAIEHDSRTDEAVPHATVVDQSVHREADTATGAHDEAASARAAAPGATISIAEGVVQFIRVAGLGLVLGIGFGVSAFWLLKKLEDDMLENAITIVLVWGSFILAERLGASGVIAVVVAGLIVGNYGHRFAMSAHTVNTVNTFWSSIDFIVNSIVFLLIGFELQAIGGWQALLHVKVLLAVAAVFAAIMLSRALMVYPVAFTLGRHWPSAWKHIVFWSGMKGSIPLALVLGLPSSELKTFLVPIAFGVVLVSLVLQGLTMPWLIRKLGVSKDMSTTQQVNKSTS